VRGYIVFYVVVGDTMEVRRILYSRRNIAEIL
ncbi:MAG: type II toxin-antitoxin system RelE/ParE family toxin, partial [Selenomonas artemidis]|nr:type II toxin-antitoxin system RelE/ParE family toxin [Selenomonas artemidis]